MGFWGYKSYVSVADRGVQAEKLVAKLRKKGEGIQPVRVEGRTISTSVWGKAWCSNLESYRDYEHRLPRGRSYLRNGSVVDLKVAKGSITAKVLGSELYDIKITIAPVAAPQWAAICRACSGGIASLVELLQGRLDKSVMDRVASKGDGLFPAPAEIKLSCSCPDWADMCKHVAAAMYGVGARLDSAPELLFVLRGVDAKDMIAKAGANLGRAKPAATKDKVLVEDDMAALFGLDMAETEPEAEIAIKPAKARTAVAVPRTAKTRKVAKSKTAKTVAKKRARPIPEAPVQKTSKRSTVAA
jgi:uncharacterized Zn finger protein